MRKGTKIAIFSTGFVCFTFAVVGFGYWRATKKAPTKTAVVATTSSTPSSLSTTANLGVGLSVGNNAGLGGGTEVATSVDQQSTTPKAKAAASTTPGPESFAQYEQYKDSKTTMFSDSQVGTGAELTAGKKAAVVYKVYLTNGTLVDQSSIDKASGKLQAFTFTLGDHSVIPGWEQGVFGMKVNGIRRMIIPAALAYGAQGQSGVPPNSMLIIDVQLLQVE